MKPSRSRQEELSLLDVARSESLRADLEQHLGDFCHQCRNRLNSLKLSLYLAKRQSAGIPTARWRVIESEYLALERQITWIHLVCRPLALTLTSLDLDLLIEDRRPSWAEIILAGGGRLELVHPGSPCPAHFDPNHLGVALDSLISWRSKHCGGGVVASLTWWLTDDEVHLSWRETPATNHIDQATCDQHRSVWELPVLARIVAAHGGRFQIGEGMGWNITISWPGSPGRPVSQGERLDGAPVRH